MNAGGLGANRPSIGDTGHTGAAGSRVVLANHESQIMKTMGSPMRARFAAAIVIDAALSCSGSFAASACGGRIDLAAIEQRMADRALQDGVKERATALKAKAAAA